MPADCEMTSFSFLPKDLCELHTVGQRVRCDNQTNVKTSLHSFRRRMLFYWLYEHVLYCSRMTSPCLSVSSRLVTESVNSLSQPSSCCTAGDKGHFPIAGKDILLPSRTVGFFYSCQCQSNVINRPHWQQESNTSAKVTAKNRKCWIYLPFQHKQKTSNNKCTS